MQTHPTMFHMLTRQQAQAMERVSRDAWMFRPVARRSRRRRLSR